MSVLESVRMALESIASNKLRSFLTMLGVVIGVASMQTMVALVEGARKDVVQQLASLGSKSIYVIGKPFDPDKAPESEWRARSQGIRESDVAALERLPGVKEARPMVAGVSVTVAANGKTKTGELNGVTPKEMPSSGLELTSGRFVIWSDVDMASKVVVLGYNVTQELYGELDPVGSSVTINGVSYDVIGAIGKRGGRGMQNYDNVVFVPVSAALKRVLGSDTLPAIVVEGNEDADLDELMALVKMEMKALHGNVEDFEAISQKAILEAVGKILRVIAVVLGGVGGLSLVVGGIGIMNIMLVTVTERTREIGIRKAVGARKRDVLRQFVIESMVLAGVGGGIGVLLGLGLTRMFGSVSQELKFFVPLWALLLSFGFAFSTGMVFGIYPAMRAANLDPIEALRYE